MNTHLREMADGRLIEYRRVPREDALFLEHRELRRDGTPFNDGWYPVSDAHLLAIQRDGSIIVELLAEGRFE